MFSKLLGVVYIALLTTKIFEMVYYTRKSSYFLNMTIRCGHLGRHLEYIRVLEEDFLEHLLW